MGPVADGPAGGGPSAGGGYGLGTVVKGALHVWLAWWVPQV
nr:hypothetical protein [Streptomyces sp. TLI_235]